MEQMLQNTLSQIGIALISLAGAYALFLIGKAKAKLTEVTQKQIQDETQRKLIISAFDRLSVLTSNVVAQTEQVTASALREAVKDGKVDKSELELLGKQSVETIYNQLNTDTKTLLESQLSDVKSYIETLVESEVLKLKK